MTPTGAEARAAARYATMQDTARAVAADFLQSVVVVDDLAALGGPAESLAIAVDQDIARAEGEPVARSRTRRTLPALRVPATQGRAVVVPDQALDAKVLIDGFAEHGLVCAVLRPSADETTESENPGTGKTAVARTVKAARRADIVVLDWELNGDAGATTLAVVQRLVHEEAGDGAKGRLRLIAIYSGTPNLRRVATRLRKALADAHGGERVRVDDEFTLTAGHVRIIALAKQTTRLDHADDALKNRMVLARALPDRLVDEFTHLTTGLVPHVAVASLAALRRNTHRLLARLAADLDAGYLWHRATQSRPADAEEHLVSLVASELRSVLDDERVGDWANLDAVRQWLAKDGKKNFAADFGETAVRTAADVEELLSKGAAGKSDSNKRVRENFRKMCVEKGEAHRREDIRGFANTSAAAKRSNEDLAARMSLRTRYDNPPPTLELGTILAKGRGRSRTYWLCVQPRCDSVRLKGDTPFPLLPLRPAEGKKFDVLLPDGRGGYQRLLVSKKPAELQPMVFAVAPAGGDVVTAEKSGGGYRFTARNRTRYSWVAELKPDHAQRIIQQVATEFARVGLTESEWLRLWATKG